MDNPRATYSRGIWQGGGATVLKPYDASGVFKKVLEQKAAKEKKVSQQAADFDKLSNIKGKYDESKREWVDKKQKETFDEVTRLWNEVNGDFDSDAGRANRMKINSTILTFENELNQTILNKKAHDELFKKLNTQRPYMFDEQYRSNVDKMEAAFKELNPTEEAITINKMMDDSDNTLDWRKKTDDMTTIAKVVGKYVVPTKTGFQFLQPDGTVWGKKIEEITKDDVETFAKQLAGDYDFMETIKHTYDYKVDKNQYPKFEDYANARIKQLTDPFINKNTWQTQTPLGGGSSGLSKKQAQNTDRTNEKYNFKTTINGQSYTSDLDSYPVEDVNKYKPTDPGALLVLPEGTIAIDQAYSGKVTPGKNVPTIFTTPVYIAVLKDDVGTLKSGQKITQEMIDNDAKSFAGHYTWKPYIIGKVYPNKDYKGDITADYSVNALMDVNKLTEATINTHLNDHKYDGVIDTPWNNIMKGLKKKNDPNNDPNVWYYGRPK